MPVYQGRNSCYAKREGIYVKRIRKPGIDTLREAVAIAKLILRDYRRGYTYEQGSCKRIKMTRKLFEKRLRFLIFLAKQHGASEDVVKAVKRLVAFVLKRGKLPKTVRVGNSRVEVRKLLKGMYARATAGKEVRRRKWRRRGDSIFTG